MIKTKERKRKKVGWKKNPKTTWTLISKKKKVSKEECAGTFWAAPVSELLPIVFSPFLEEKFLVDPGIKHLSPLTFFFPLPLPTKHPLKLLSFHFSFLNFPSSLKSLQTTHPYRQIWGVINFFSYHLIDAINNGKGDFFFFFLPDREWQRRTYSSTVDIQHYKDIITIRSLLKSQIWFKFIFFLWKRFLKRRYTTL